MSPVMGSESKHSMLSEVRRMRLDLDEERRMIDARLRAMRGEEQPESDPDRQKPKPIDSADRSQNKLRPRMFSDIVGQEGAKEMMQRVVQACLARREPLDHTLLIGPAGTGKTTFANVISNELGHDCYQVAAPVSFETLLDLREVMKEGDVLFVDEIHMQAVQERRGKEAMSSPEVFLTLLEDSVIAAPSGMLGFPRATIIGATTDPGRLPDPFLDRFPLQPRLQLYSQRELSVIAETNAAALELTLMPGVAESLAGASRGTPRIVNNYMKNAASLVGPDRYVPPLIADQVLRKLNDVTHDGLTHEMQAALKFLLRRCQSKDAKGNVRYRASVSHIATGIGLSRDTKAVQFRVEPYLIEQGYLAVGSRGRELTTAGIRRAAQLLEEGAPS